jgi:hypothetical protein
MRPLIVFSSLLLAAAIVLALCALFGVGIANQYDPATPRWTTVDVATLFLAASALSFAVTSLTIVRWPVGTRHSLAGSFGRRRLFGIPRVLHGLLCWVSYEIKPAATASSAA